MIHTKRKIIIEEMISQEFEVEVDSMEVAVDQIRSMYKSGKLIVDNPTLLSATLNICDENGDESNWIYLL